MATSLIADQSAPVRKAAQFLLESLGFEVAGARDAGETLATVRGLSPDLVIVDARIGGAETLSLIEKIRALPEGAETCILFVADGGPASIRAAMDAGADDYLIKPFDRELLSFKLDQARARGRLRTRGTPMKLVQDNSHSWRFRVFGKAV